MKNKNPVVWFEIYTKEIERAQKFYEKVLNIKLTKMFDPNEEKEGDFRMLAFPSDKDSIGAAPEALVQMKGFDVGKNSTIVYFSSDDCSKEESRVVSAGGKVVKPKMSIGEFGFISLATDTEGNMFGVHSMV